MEFDDFMAIRSLKMTEKMREEGIEDRESLIAGKMTRKIKIVHGRFGGAIMIEVGGDILACLCCMTSQRKIDRQL